jgi:hypothetical protein
MPLKGHFTFATFLRQADKIKITLRWPPPHAVTLNINLVETCDSDV